jgi:hypothetical protein
VPETRTYLHGRSISRTSSQVSFLFSRVRRHQEQLACTSCRRSGQRGQGQRSQTTWASRRGTCCIGPLSPSCTSSSTPRRVLWLCPSGWKSGTPITYWVTQSTIVGHSKYHYRSLKVSSIAVEENSNNSYSSSSSSSYSSSISSRTVVGSSPGLRLEGHRSKKEYMMREMS